MRRQFSIGQMLCCVFAAIFIVAEVQASDLSELLWGGRGSRTTVTDPYIPPPLMTEMPVIPATDTAATATTQSNLMLGTPGAMTIPPGGVIAANGVATTGVVPATYVWPGPVTTASPVIPVAQVTPTQPVIEYEWTYSTIKDTSYDPITVYDPRLGGYVTTYQERQTESVLPWLHRKQVVRYKPTTAEAAAANSVTGGTIIGNPVVPVASDTSERYIVNRLFPVSTVPSPPVQTVPVQTVPLPAVPTTTYAAEPPVTSTVMRVGGELPVVTAITIPQIGGTQPTTETVTITPATTMITTQNQPAPITSSLADMQPSLPQVVSPSSQQVLFPTVPVDNSSNNTPDTMRTGTRPNEPTLAPPKSDTGSDQAPVAQETLTLQRQRIEDSLSSSEKPLVFELSPGASLPSVQASVIPTLNLSSGSVTTEATTMPNTTNGGIPLLTSPGTESPTQSATQPATRGTQPGRNVAPTRMLPPAN